ncbi:phosphopantetheine-binding protein [Micromonospora sp. NPDC005203]|uniref:phosphopantetheine-binding protein n=1 Tax=Micromonospora sp. NPDC005203 TaxID=3364226 RepID=UPI0036B370BB
MSHWIEPLFTGLLPDATIAAAVADYPAYRDVDLAELGLESLATMQIAIRMTELFNYEIDYESFTISALQTFGGLERQLGLVLTEV